MWRGENAAMAERSRSELAGALHPANDATGVECVRDSLDQLWIGEFLDVLTILPRYAQQILRVHMGAPEWMIRQVPVRLAKVHTVRIERRAQCAAGVAGRRRDKHAFEAGLVKDSGVRHAVESNAAAETQIRQARLLVEGARQIDQRFFEHPLYAGGAIGESVALRGI